MKKFLAIVVIAGALVACNNSGDSSTSADSPKTNQDSGTQMNSTGDTSHMNTGDTSKMMNTGDTSKMSTGDTSKTKK